MQAKYVFLAVASLIIVGVGLASATKVKQIGSSKNEPQSQLFSRIEEVSIAGYDSSQMEPCITADGKYLFFNDSNGPKAKSKIHLSKRVDESHFEYLGKVLGVSSDYKDLAPTIDVYGNFYFTSLREYPKTLKSLFYGKFQNESVSKVKAISGDISSRKGGWLNMDCEVSRDGNLFCYSRARFEVGGHLPVESNLYLASVEDGKIVKKNKIRTIDGKHQHKLS